MARFGMEGKMDINQVLTELDNMFDRYPPEEIEAFLIEKIALAEAEGDKGSHLSLLSELMGLCRESGKRELGLNCAEKILKLLTKMNLEGTAVYGTILLNIANAYRAFGKFSESEQLYQEVLQIYKSCLAENDFNFASLYNNWSLLHQEQRNYKKAAEKLRLALSIVEQYPQAVVEQATSLTNLANSLLQTRDEADHKEAIQLLYLALDLFEKDGGRDYHYGAALSAMGNALYLDGRYQDSASYNKRAMDELNKHMGKSEMWKRVEHNYQEALKKANDDETV